MVLFQNLNLEQIWAKEKTSTFRSAYYWRISYQASGDELEDEACYDGTKKLGNPVEDASEDSDLATKSQSKCDSWVHMAPRDVGSNWNCNKESKAMADGNGY